MTACRNFEKKAVTGRIRRARGRTRCRLKVNFPLHYFYESRGGGRIAQKRFYGYAGLMGAAEIIDLIESLPLAERVRVYRYITGEQEILAGAQGVWRGLNIRQRQKRVCGESVFANLVLEARQLERY